jgi:hypothetical protein
MLLLLLACKQVVPTSPGIESLLDQWWQTQDEIPFAGAPACGLLSSNGTAEIEGDDAYIGPVEWEAVGDLEVRISYSGFHLGNLKFDLDPLVVDYNILGNQGVASCTFGCDL